jgi:hypothetical protein
MTIEIEKWAFVDSADGRRWLGEVELVQWEERAAELAIPICIRFSRAVEEWPYGSTTVMLAEKTLAGGGQIKFRNEEIGNVAGNFVTPCKRAFMPPWTLVRPVGLCWLRDYPSVVAADFRIALESLETVCNETLRKAKLETEIQKGKLI